MAELAVGLSKSVVVGAITKVQSVIDEDSRLRHQVKRDLVFISLELEMMQSFLNDASEETRNNVVSTWVNNIRQLAYDVEDCVGNVVHLDNKPIFWRRLLPPCMAPPLPLDVAAEEIDQLKSRVEDVNNCYRRYNLVNANSAAAATALEAGSKPASSMKKSDAMLLAEARDATRRNKAFGDLTSLIPNKGYTGDQVISVWGEGGDDETTSILREAFSHPEISQDFTYRAWVKLMNPFSPEEFIMSMMAQFYANSCGEEKTAIIGLHVLEKMKVGKEAVFSEFKQLAGEKRYLIVLEGLSTMVDWDAIRTFLPDRKIGSCIIVSTKQPKLSILCIGHSYHILELKKFSDDHSVCALFKEPYVHGPKQFPSHDEIVSSRNKQAIDWMEDNRLVGSRLHIDRLHEYLESSSVDSSRVVSVWGMAGTGKSYLVRHMYADTMLVNKQFTRWIWVDVSYPFNLRGFSRSLLQDYDQGKDPIQGCRQLLEQQQCLVVMDGLRSKEEWDLIKEAFVSPSSRSVIIVITTEESVAAWCTRVSGYMFNIKCLEADAALDLFKMEVHIKNPLFSYKKKRLEEIIMRCGGFPAVIVALADVLAKLSEEEMDKLYSLPHGFLPQLEQRPELQGLFRWMHSVIFNPPDFLKPCIFYLSIFPPNCSIRRTRLVRRWVAEGYSKKSVEKYMENAELFFSELVHLSIFQQEPHKKPVSYKVNSLIRDYIISRQVEENLVFELAGDCVPPSQSRGRHLVVSETWSGLGNYMMYRSMDFSRLWSLTVFGEWMPYFISPNMEMLRVLDLEGITSKYNGVRDRDLVWIGHVLPRLKFLSVRGCMEVTRLPDSLGSMTQLETLDARHTSIVELPPAIITKLHKLQYIRAGSVTTEEARRRQAEAEAAASPSPPAEAAPSPSPSQEDVNSGTEEGQHLPATEDTTSVGEGASTRARKKGNTNSSRWWETNESKKQRRRRRVAENGGGVEVDGAAAEGFGQLTDLHTLGVVNIAAGGKGARIFLRMVRTLTQLHKLGLSGVNHQIWGYLCRVIEDLPHLESLSLQLLLLEEEEDGNYEFACFDDIWTPPKNMKRLKVLYTTPAGAGAGHACIEPAWIKQLPNLQGFDHVLTVSRQEEIDSLLSHGFPTGLLQNRLCIKLDNQNLSFAKQTPRLVFLHLLMIGCRRTDSTVTFGESPGFSVEVVSIHCCISCGGSSCLKIVGLKNICGLKKVMLTGPCSVEFKEDLRMQLEEHQDNPALDS